MEIVYNTYSLCTLYSLQRLHSPEVIDKKFLQISSLKVLEPDSSLCLKTELEEIDLVLVPGLGFNIDGFRLGYGKGFYDRLLSFYKAKSIAIGYKEQFYSKIPVENHDQRVKELCLF